MIDLAGLFWELKKSKISKHSGIVQDSWVPTFMEGTYILVGYLQSVLLKTQEGITNKIKINK